MKLPKLLLIIYASSRYCAIAIHSWPPPHSNLGPPDKRPHLPRPRNYPRPPIRRKLNPHLPKSVRLHGNQHRHPSHQSRRPQHNRYRPRTRCRSFPIVFVHGGVPNAPFFFKHPKHPIPHDGRIRHVSPPVFRRHCNNDYLPNLRTLSP